MKRILLTITGSLLIVFGLLLINKEKGYFNIPLFSVPSGHVRIKFINESPEVIQSIKRKRGLSSPVITNLKPYTSDYILIKHSSGEGTCDFSVVFESGKTLSCSEAYIEPGYYLTYTIQQDSVYLVY